MQKGRKTIVAEYQEKVAELNKAMSERGLQLFQDKFLDMPFKELPSTQWLDAAHRALRRVAPKAISADKKKYLKLAASEFGTALVLTNEEFAMLSNAAEYAGPDELGMYLPDYEKHLDESEWLIGQYNAELHDARQAIDDIVKAEFMEAHKDLEAKYKSQLN